MALKTKQTKHKRNCVLCTGRTATCVDDQASVLFALTTKRLQSDNVAPHGVFNCAWRGGHPNRGPNKLGAGLGACRNPTGSQGRTIFCTQSRRVAVHSRPSGQPIKVYARLINHDQRLGPENLQLPVVELRGKKRGQEEIQKTDLVSLIDLISPDENLNLLVLVRPLLVWLALQPLGRVLFLVGHTALRVGFRVAMRPLSVPAAQPLVTRRYPVPRLRDHHRPQGAWASARRPCSRTLGWTSHAKPKRLTTARRTANEMPPAGTAARQSGAATINSAPQLLSMTGYHQAQHDSTKFTQLTQAPGTSDHAQTGARTDKTCPAPVAGIAPSNCARDSAGASTTLHPNSTCQYIPATAARI